MNSRSKGILIDCINIMFQNDISTHVFYCSVHKNITNAFINNFCNIALKTLINILFKITDAGGALTIIKEHLN